MAVEQTACPLRWPIETNKLGSMSSARAADETTSKAWSLWSPVDMLLCICLYVLLYRLRQLCCFWWRPAATPCFYINSFFPRSNLGTPGLFVCCGTEKFCICTSFFSQRLIMLLYFVWPLTGQVREPACVQTNSGRLPMPKDFPSASTYDAQLWLEAHQLVEAVARDPHNSDGLPTTQLIFWPTEFYATVGYAICWLSTLHQPLAYLTISDGSIVVVSHAWYTYATGGTQLLYSPTFCSSSCGIFAFCTASRSYAYTFLSHPSTIHLEGYTSTVTR